MKRTLIIAEAGVNHNGELALAKKLVEAGAEAGADRVKFQTFSAAKLASKDAGAAAYQKRNLGQEVSQLEMLKKLELSREDHFVLREECRAHGTEFLSSPFDEASADFLVGELGLKQIKIPSGEITNAPLLLRLARMGASVIMSTGMCDMDDIEAALGVLAYGYMNVKSAPSSSEFKKAFSSPIGKASLTEKVILLHCTSNYPAAAQEVNLRAMTTMAEKFGLPVGYSDHTLGIEVSLAAVARGAVCIEKHFTLDKNLPGPDHKASLSVEELNAMVSGIRAVEAAMGDGKKQPQASELDTRTVARKSLVALAPIRKGEKFTAENLGTKRPGSGRSPFDYWDMLGQPASRDYKEDEII